MKKYAIYDENTCQLIVKISDFNKFVGTNIEDINDLMYYVNEAIKDNSIKDGVISDHWFELKMLVKTFIYMYTTYYTSITYDKQYYEVTLDFTTLIIEF